MTRDAAALDPLLAVMAAAGRHDTDAALAALDEAETHLGDGFHQARTAIDAARDAARAGSWYVVWASAWQATCGLTWAFPPDPTRCPPAPAADPYGPAGDCGGCGTPVPDHARYCHSCGTPRT